MRPSLFIIFCFLSFNFLYAQTDLDVGLQYYQESEYEKALEYLETSRKDNDPRAYDALLNSNLSLKRYEEAADIVKHYLKKSNLNPLELLTDLLYVSKLEGNEKEAGNALESIKEKIEKNPGLAYTAGNALQKRGYAKESMEVYLTAEKINPAMNFDYQKALLYGEMGDIQNMYAMYVQMVKRSPNMLANVKNLLAQGIAQSNGTADMDYLKQLLVKEIQDGAHQNMNELLIFVYIQEENYRGAFTQLKALDKRHGGNKAELFNLGVICNNNEEYDLARKIFEYILDAGKDNPFYGKSLVQILKGKQASLENREDVKTEEWRTLQKEYARIHRLLHGEMEWGELNIDMARITAFRLNDIDSAISLLESTIKSSFVSREDQAKAKIELGDILLYTGEQWEAIIYYGQAEKAFEQSPIGQEAKFKRAKAAYFVGNFEWAMGIFDALKASTSKLIANDAMQYSLLINDHIALDTNTDAMMEFARADLFHYQGQLDSSLYILSRLKNNYPNHSLQDDALFLEAKILVRKQRYIEAVESLKQIVDFYADDILADDALFLLADIYENKLQQAALAKDYYQQLFIDYPDSFHTAEARKRFRLLRGDNLN